MKAQLVKPVKHDLKCYCTEKIVYKILILVNYNYEMSKNGILGFSISYLVLKIFRFLIYLNYIAHGVIVSQTKIKFTKLGISLESLQIIGRKFSNLVYILYSCHGDCLETGTWPFVEQM